ncbi:MAG: hypothetical protein U5K56_07660 [Halioglobus sp.]|nr:hypothetical protein [Halioglobus sp.]
MHTALTHPEKLAGLMVLSSFFPAGNKVQPHPANRDLPIHVFHGTQDSMAPESLGQQTVAILREKGYAPRYKTYPMAHAVCPQEITDISAWLQGLLGGALTRRDRDVLQVCMGEMVFWCFCVSISRTQSVEHLE